MKPLNINNHFMHFTEAACDLFAEAAFENKETNAIDTSSAKTKEEIVRNLEKLNLVLKKTGNSSSLLLSYSYVEKLHKTAPDLVQTLSNAQLLMITLLLAIKYLNDDGENTQQLWDLIDIAEQEMKSFEKVEFEVLNALKWRLHLPSHKFNKLSTLFHRKVLRSKIRFRRHVDYTDLTACLTDSLFYNKLVDAISTCIKTMTIAATVYFLTVGLSAALVVLINARHASEVISVCESASTDVDSGDLQTSDDKVASLPFLDYCTCFVITLGSQFHMRMDLLKQADINALSVDNTQFSEQCGCAQYSGSAVANDLSLSWSEDCASSSNEKRSAIGLTECSKSCSNTHNMSVKSSTDPELLSYALNYLSKPIETSLDFIIPSKAK